MHPLNTSPHAPASGPHLVEARWQAAVHTNAFRQLIASKRNILLPMVVLYLGVFLGICLLAGYARPWFAQPSIGAYSLGNLLIFGTYLMSWLLALAYVWIADRTFDRQAAAAVAADPGRPA